MANKQHIIVAHAYDKRGRILAVATNSYKKTHPLQSYFAEKVGQPERHFLHAEIACLVRCKDQSIHTLRIWRYGKDGQLLCAKPCGICMEAIKAFGPKEIWYSDYGTMVKL